MEMTQVKTKSNTSCSASNNCWLDSPPVRKKPQSKRRLATIRAQWSRAAY